MNMSWFSHVGSFVYAESEYVDHLLELAPGLFAEFGNHLHQSAWMSVFQGVNIMQQAATNGCI